VHGLLQQKLRALATQREEIEAAKKALRKRLQPPPSLAAAAASAPPPVASSDAAGAGGGPGSAEGPASTSSSAPALFIPGPEWAHMDEIYKLRSLSSFLDSVHCLPLCL
jgi:hypothetical protein